MGFNVKDWKDYPDTSTPITAASLEDVETRVSDFTANRTAVSVMEYGADPTGATDSTTAIQNAIAACSGKTLYFPPGKYLAHVSVTGVDDLVIEGSGSGSVIHNATSSVDALKFVDCDDLTIRHLRVQGAGGTRDGLHLENCQRAHLSRVLSLGTGRACIWAQRCFGIVVDNCVASRDSVGPYPSGVGLQQAGLVLTWDGSATDSGCNQAVVNGGSYVIGQTPQASTSTETFTPGWAMQLIRADGAVINGPITELSAGGIYLGFCQTVSVNGYYCELNPSAVEYTTGTMSVTAGATAVTGSGTDWDNTPGSFETKHGAAGKYLVAPLGAGMTFAKVAALNSDTSLTLASNGEDSTTGWSGATQSGANYRLTSFDVFLDNTTDSRIVSGKGGSSIALRSSSRNKIEAVCDSLLIDDDSLFNECDVIVNRANMGSLGPRVVRAVVGNSFNTLRSTDYQGNSIVTPLQVAHQNWGYFPTAANCAGAIIFCPDYGTNGTFFGSDGTNWLALS